MLAFLYLRVKIFIHRFFTSIHMLSFKQYTMSLLLGSTYMDNNLDFLSLFHSHSVAL